MKCKSLILGPAAALLVAPSGALAADAMMKDEMGPVTVCEAYGSGWFFSPGTETCLKIHGNARFQYESDSVDGQGSAQNWDWRGQVNIRANSETEAGTLSSRIQFEAAGTGDDAADAAINWVEIGIGGFRVGRRDGFWFNDAYGYYNARYDGEYGGLSGVLADYTFRMNGFSATVGVSENADDVDFYAGANWSGGGLHLGVVWFDAQAGGKNAVAAVPAGNGSTTTYAYNGTAYDTFAEAVAVAVNEGDDSSDVTTVAAGDPAVAAVDGGGTAWRIVAAYDLGFVAPGAAVRGWYSDDSGETDYSNGARWGISGKVGLGDELTLFTGYSQHETDPLVAANAEETTHFAIGVSWVPLPGLLVQPEYASRDNPTGTADVDTFGVRVVRSF